MLVDDLKVLLGSTFVLYVKAHGFHFNVEGSNFYQHHEFLGKYYEDVFETIDTIGEHIRTLESYTPGAMIRYLELSKIPEQIKIAKDMAMFSELLRDNTIMTEILKHCFKVADSEDKQGIADFIAGRIDAHEKWGWMIKSILK